MTKEKDKKIILGISILIVIGMGFIVYYFWNKNHSLQVVFEENKQVEINSKVTCESLIQTIKNGTLEDTTTLIDTSTLGTKTIEVKVLSNNNQEKVYTVSIHVVDTVKPEIQALKELTVKVGSNVDILKNVMVTDNSNEEIKVNVSGKYDLSKEGDYHLTYEAEDSSKNKTTMDFILHVKSTLNNDYTFLTKNGFEGKVVDGILFVDDVLIVNKSYSVPSNYGNGLTKETKDAFNAMEKEARSLGLNLYISSGYRSYDTQSKIYNRYVDRDGKEKADTYSARPGYSEHQTGLAFDLNSISDAFAQTAEGKWVRENCYRYGLILRYPEGKEEITGYQHESWHLRYVGNSLAEKMYNNGDWITLEEYYGIESFYS